MKSSLQFLLQAMQALRRKNPLTESFLVQLDLDLEGAGIEKPYMPVEKKNSVVPVNSDPVGCSSIYEIRETQAQNAPINQYANSRASSANAVPHFSISNGQQVPAFGTSGGGIEVAPRSTPFMPLRNLSEVGQVPQDRDIVPGAATFLFTDSNPNEMDLSGDQPSPSTVNSQSRGGSTSHSSYSPGQQAEHLLPYRASPRFTSTQMPMSRPQQSQAQNSSAASMAPLFSSSSDIPMNAYPADAIHNGAYDNSFDWELSAMNNGVDMGTEMDAAITPGTWNSMLESVMETVPLGWGVVGTPHVANIDVPGAARS
jgi:hypothetical protein